MSTQPLRFFVDAEWDNEAGALSALGLLSIALVSEDASLQVRERAHNGLLQLRHQTPEDDEPLVDMFNKDSIEVLRNGGVFYATLPFYAPRIGSEWVRENVLPKLGQTPTYNVSDLRAELQMFLAHQARKTGAQEIEIIADYPEDLKYMADLMVLGPGVAADYGVRTVRLTYCRALDVSLSAVPHNALADAMALRDSFLENKTQP